ncbi:MAG: hypothetical protein WKF96_21935 [Solirubrobacteraceae bacterium]
MVLAVSRINESVPLFLGEGIVRRLGTLSGRKVAVLGLAFKAGTGDKPDSRAHKLVRLLEREPADVAVHFAYANEIAALAPASRARRTDRFRFDEQTRRISAIRSSSPTTTHPSSNRASFNTRRQRRTLLGAGRSAGAFCPLM